jgi:membrane protein
MGHSPSDRAPSDRAGWRGETIFSLCRTAVMDWIEDRATSRGAAIAYYTVFSIAPLLLLIIAVAGLVWGQDATQGAVLGQLGGLTGPAGATALEDMVRSASDRESGLIATVTSVILLLLGATTVFAELQDALNQMWNAPPAKASGLWAWLRGRVLSLSLIVTIGFLLLVSLVLSTVVTALSERLAQGAEIGLLVEAMHLLTSLIVTTAMFAAIYKILPDVAISWGDVAVGAGLTAILFHIGKYVIAAYIGLSDIASSYGAASALVIILIWVYYSAQIFLLGAEFTKVYAFTVGSRRADAARRPRGKAPNAEARAVNGTTPPEPASPASGPAPR